MDPYREWLQVREERRPPNHYELLNLRQFEPDAQLIQKAYGEQMAKARRYQVGAHMDVAQRIVNELSEAFVCLTDPRRKEAYDAFLRGGETFDGQILKTVETSAPARPAAPVLRPPPLPATDSSQPAESTPGADRRTARAKRNQPPPVVIAFGLAGLVCIPIVLWIASSSSKAPVVKEAAPASPPKQAAPPKPAPPPPETRESKLADLLKGKPAPGVEARFFALLLTTSGDTVTVTPRAGTPKIAVVFPGPIEPLLKGQGFRPDDLVEITGTVARNDDPAIGLCVAGEAIQKADAPASRILAKDLPAPPASPPPASPPQVASVPKTVISPSPPTPPVTQPPAPPPSTPSAPPVTAKPALPADWAEQLVQGEATWKRLGKASNGSRHALSGEFAALEVGDPPVVRLQLGTTEAAIRGPFTAEGLTFARRLQAKDPVEFGIRVTEAKAGGGRLSMIWMARAGANETQRTAFQPPPSTTPQTLSLANLNRPIHAVAWSPTSNRLLVASEPAVIVDAATGQKLQELSTDDCQQAEWSSDGRYVALRFDRLNNPPPGRFGGACQVYDTTTGKQMFSLPTSDYGEALFTFNPKSLVLAMVHDKSSQNVFNYGQKQITQFNFTAGKQAGQLVEEFQGTARLAWKRDGSQLAWAIRGNKSGIRLMRAGSRGAPTGVPLNGTINDLAWVPNSSLLAVCGPDGLQVGDMSNIKQFKLVLTLAGVNTFERCSFSSDGRLAAVELNSALQVWRLDNSSATQWTRNPSSRWQALAWSPTTPLLAALDSDGSVVLCNEDGQKMATLKSGLTVSRGGLAWNASGQRLAVFGQNDKIVVFDTAGF